MRVRHAKLICLLNGHLDRVVMTKALPLCVDRVHRSPRKESLLYKLLPVDLILVLARRIFVYDPEYFDELADCEASALLVMR